jgi:hypothetical protein
LYDSFFERTYPSLRERKLDRENALRSTAPALWDNKEFRSLRRATKGPAFGIRKLLKKLDQNSYCAQHLQNNSAVSTGKLRCFFIISGNR